MLQDVVGFLRCPNCRTELDLSDGSLRCRTRHSFDVAREGYVSLLLGKAKTGPGDTAAMVEARTAFLGAGHLDPIVRSVEEVVGSALPEGPEGCVADIGAGTGYYLARVLDRASERVGVALDISKYAARRAARAHVRMGAVVCDVWRSLPLRTGLATIALNIFAPRNGAEIKRVLHPGGTLVVVTPTPGHLAEIVEPLSLLTVDERKSERLDDQLSPHLTKVDHIPCEFQMQLGRRDIKAAVAMGPSAHHAEKTKLDDAIGVLPESMEVTASVVVSTYRRS